MKEAMSKAAVPAQASILKSHPDAAAKVGANKRPMSNATRIRAVELTAGCARLTRTLSDRGLQAVGVDWMKNKSKPLAPVILIDLAADDAVSKFESLLDGNDVVFTHGAPPCGTA